MKEYDKLKSDTFDNSLRLTVEDQHKLAEILAANCGYQLVAEETERSLEIKELIKSYKQKLYTRENQLLIQALEALLK